MDQIEFVINQRFIDIMQGEDCIATVYKPWFRRHLKVLRKQNEKDLKLRIDEIRKDASWNYTLLALGSRALFSSELEKKLMDRKGDLEALEKAKRYGYIDDARELNNALERGFAKGKGPIRLVREICYRSKLPRAVVEEAAMKHMPFEQCVKRARQLAKRYKLPDDQKRAYGYLARRGFSFDVIQNALRICAD